MLLELNIRDFAIIDRLNLQFAPGFNVLTGETGAGKSILIDALGTLLGDKPDPSFVRAGAASARVEGVFGLHEGSELGPVLQQYGLDDGEEQLIMVREINATSGRSVARINGRAVNGATLREVAGYLVDIHGQHENVSLFNVKTHLDLLDRLGNLVAQRDQVREVVDQIRQVRQRLDDLRRSEARRQDRIDELQYQIDEILAAELRPGEEDELAQERMRLQNGAKITTLANTAYQLLAEGDDGPRGAQPVVDQLSAAVAAIDELARYDSTLNGTVEQANELLYRLEDLAATVRDYRDNLEFDPHRLEEIEDRFLMLRSLQRKYSLTIDELIASVTTAQDELDMLTHAAEHLSDLEAQEERLLRTLSALAGDLSARRRETGEQLNRRIEQSMADLAMPHVKFAVGITHVPDARGVEIGENGSEPQRVQFDKTGIDRVEFLLSPNPGEPLKPLARIASGGESARLLLAMKSILSEVDTVPTLVFDEVDVGVGGRAGGVVGEKLWGMSTKHQVLCITHLPQVAAFGDAHYTIRKQIAEGRTRSDVALLDKDGVIDELAEMLDGRPLSDASRESARTMIGRAGQHKRQRNYHERRLVLNQ